MDLFTATCHRIVTIYVTTLQVSITVLATGFATDFFDSDGELGTGEGLESLQPMKVATPKTASGARQYAEKTYIPAGLDEKINYDGTAPTRQKISSDRDVSQEKAAAAAQSRSNEGRTSTKKKSRREEQEEDDDDFDDDADSGSAREGQSQRDRDSDPKRYNGIRGFFRKIFD